ncbi:MFS transporter [Pseudomonas sp. BN414]|uniref:MFS transporter n=1 Tax=Pseudomonas TaxID=286 RepID=UPI0015BB3A4D|nr:MULTISPECIES: MFS transporter [Pseudomonas]MDH4565589.1 MFS transporter [Pseudomonas sp. BN414]NWL76014.1 MFS transporter [Pseudomonas taiwanensis]
MKRWSVLFGCFLGMSIAPPAILLIPLGLFMKSVSGEFAWSRTEFSIILSAAAVCNALVMPLAGYLVDRFGASRVALLGTLLGCGSYMCLSLAHSFGAFVAITAMSVALGNLASYPAFLFLTQRWFDKHLGLAFAITSSGLAVGTGGFSYLISQHIEMHGWREALVVAGGIALVIGLVNLAVFVRDNKGPIPEAERSGGKNQQSQDGLTLRSAMATGDFWLYSCAFVLVLFGAVGCSFHLPAMLSDWGATGAQIAGIVAAGSAGSLFGRLLGGVLLDHLHTRTVAGLFLAGQLVGFLLLLDQLTWALPASFLIGAMQGAEIDILGYLIARRFGRLAYARIFGSAFSVTLLGAIVGPIALGMVFDKGGSYHLGLMLFPILPVLAFGLLCMAAKSPQQPQPSDSVNAA